MSESYDIAKQFTTCSPKREILCMSPKWFYGIVTVTMVVLIVTFLLTGILTTADINAVPSSPLGMLVLLPFVIGFIVRERLWCETYANMKTFAKAVV